MMKRKGSMTPVIFLTVLLIVSVTYSVFASTGRRPVKSTVEEHNVVVGYIEYNQYNYWHDWTDGTATLLAGGFGGITQNDISFITNASNSVYQGGYINHTVYYDLTSQTELTDMGTWHNDWHDNSSGDYIDYSFLDAEMLYTAAYEMAYTWYSGRTGDMKYNHASYVQEYKSQGYDSVQDYVISYFENRLNSGNKNPKIKYKVVLAVCDHTPLILDLNHDQKLDTAKNIWISHKPDFFTEYAQQFDMTGSGNLDFTEWLCKTPKDGMLCIPEDGKITSCLQLFGAAGGYTDGFEKLSIQCDTDKNGWIEGKELDKLFIWVDGNSNAKAEPSELKSIKELNIKKLSTSHKNFLSCYVTDDGQTHKMWDWWPSALEVKKVRIN